MYTLEVYLQTKLQYNKLLAHKILQGFVRGAQFAIALGHIGAGAVVDLAVIGCPKLHTTNVYDESKTCISDDGEIGCILSSVKGQGTFLRDLSGSMIRQLFVNEISNPSEMIVIESYESAHTDHTLSEKVYTQLGIKHPPLRMDSLAKYCSVALGYASLLPRMPRGVKRENIWDHAPGE